jgi:hypothetical protein
MLNIKQALRDIPSENIKERKKLECSLESSYYVTHAIKIMNEANPIKIFGVVANISTAGYILYPLVIVLIVLVQYSYSGQITLPS